MDLLQPTEPCLRQTKEFKIAATEQKVSHSLGICTKIKESIWIFKRPKITAKVLNRLSLQKHSYAFESLTTCLFLPIVVQSSNKPLGLWQVFMSEYDVT